MIFNFFKKKTNLPNYDIKYKELVKGLKKTTWDNWELVESMISPAVTIEQTPVNNLDLGLSKFGGNPDLPSEFKWPKHNDKSMLFFAQINLSEIKKHHRNEDLPISGIIYVFAYFPEPKNEYGAEYDFLKDKKEYTVLYYDGNHSNLKSTLFPEDIIADYKFETNKLSFELLFQIPSSFDIRNLNYKEVSKADQEKMESYNEEWSDGGFNQILGLPLPLQTGVSFEWAMSYLNYTYIDFDNKKDEIDKFAPEFINLLTMPLFEKIGDADVYIGIRKSELKNKDFSKAIFVMQGT